MSDNQDLNINIGANPSGIESGSRAAKTAINQVEKEAQSLDRAFRGLRGALDPMYAAQAKYNDALANSARLLAAGRISEEEYAASINLATAALAKQSAEQLKGTVVANQAAAALRNSSRTKTEAEVASNAAIVASSKSSAANRAAEEARLTALTALEVKNRTALAVEEAKQRLAIARKAADDSISGVQRNTRGQFVSASVIQAQRAAAVAEAEEELRLLQLDAVSASQKARNAERVANTREEAARRTVAAEQLMAMASQAAAQIAVEADAERQAAQEALTAAQEVAAAAAIRSAQAQAAAEAEVVAATKAKAQAAAAAALAEEAEAKAAAEQAAATAAAARAAAEAAAAQNKLAREEAARVASAERLKASLDSAYAAQLRYNQAVAMANGLAGSGHIDESTRVRDLAQAEKQLEEALKHGTTAAINNRSAYEGLVMVHELLEHRYSRMAGSAMILGQSLIGEGVSASILTAAFSPLGIAIMATVGAMAALAIAAYQGSAELGRLQQSLAVTGQYAGMTAQQIDKAAKQIAESTHTSIGQAEQSFAALTESGRVSGKTLVTMGEIVSRLAQMTHQKASVIANEMVKMADDPANAMKRLNEQYHFLTPAQAQHIRDLIEEGDKTGAVTELSEKWLEKLRSEQTELTGLAGALNGAGIALGNFWQHLMDIGKAPDPADRLKSLENQLALIKKLRSEGKNAQADNILAYNKTSVTGMQQEAANIKKKIDADTTASHKAQLDQQATDDRAALDALETTTKTNHEKMLREQKAWRTEANRLLKNPEASAEDKRDATFRLAHPQTMDEAIAKKYDKNDTTMSKGPGQVALWAEQLHEMEIKSTDFFKDETDDELAFWTAKLALTKKGSKEWVEVQTKVYDLQKKKAKENYDDNIIALKDKIAAAEGNLTEEEKAWQAYLDKVKSVMGETSKAYKAAVKEYIDARVKIAEAQAKADKEMQKGVFSGKETTIGMKSDLFTFQSDMGMSTARQQLAQQKQIMQEEYAAKVANEQRIFDIEQQYADKIKSLPDADAATRAAADRKLLEARATLNSNMLALDQQHARDVAQVNIESAELTMRKWKETADLINQGFMNAFQGMWTRSQSFKDSMLQMADQITYKFVQAGLDMLQHWIMTQIGLRIAHTTTQAAMTASTAAGAGARAGIENANFFSVIIGKLAALLGIHIGTETAKTAATGVGATSRIIENKIETAAAIGSAAAIAGANGVASWALAPWPIDMGAPGFGAAMAAAAAGYGTLAVAEGGWGEVSGNGVPALLHEKEMVLPAKYADPLRKTLTARNSSGMFASAASSSSMSNSNNSNAPVFNYQPTHHYRNMDAETMLQRDGAVFRKWFNNQVRNGHIKIG